MPEFSVLLPVFNGERYLDLAIQSILRQTCSDWHLLILDHCSRDRSRDIAQFYAAADKRIQVESVSAKGLADLLNKGLKMVNSRYVMRQDADDISHPDRMMLTKRQFDANPGIVVVAGQCNLIDETGRKFGRTRNPTSSEGIAASVLFYNPIAHPAVTFDLNRFNDLNCSYGADILCTLPRERSLSISDLVEDYYLFGQLSILRHCINTPEVLIDYRFHNSSISRLNSDQQLSKSVEVSQFVTDSWCQMKGLATFDVKPFTNHGTRLVSSQAGLNHDDNFNIMSHILKEGLGKSLSLSRELAFRYVISNRNKMTMLMRFGRYALLNRATSFEMHTVVSWLKT